MAPTDALSWALTAVFVVCIGLYLARVRAARTWRLRAAWALHALMALSMIAMAWPWGLRIPMIVSVLAFTASALYFAYLGLFTDALRHAAPHGAMMASMVVMAAAVDPGMAPGMASGMPPWVSWTCGLAAGAFICAALWSFYVLIRGPQRPWANLLVTTGMGVAFAALIA